MTRGQVEAKIGDAVSKFEKDYMGRGPKDIKTKIVKNHIFIIVDGSLSLSEQKLAESSQGVKLIKEMRSALFECARDQLESLIKGIINVDIISAHSDVSTKNGEKIIVLTIDRDLEAGLTA